MSLQALTAQILGELVRARELFGAMHRQIQTGLCSCRHRRTETWSILQRPNEI
jgi:hypothetical protein